VENFLFFNKGSGSSVCLAFLVVIGMNGDMIFIYKVFTGGSYVCYYAHVIMKEEDKFLPNVRQKFLA
jgi:hypothetical protein